MIPLGVLASSHVAAVGGGSLYRDEVLADSPLIYLRLDESSGPPVDYGSLGITPTAQGSWPTWGGIWLGDGDSSADFPASTGVGIGVGLISQIDTSGPATVEALIRVDSLAASRVILASSSFWEGTAARFQVSSTGALQYLGGPWPTSVKSSPGVISTATTYHVAATTTGTSCTLYVNGSTVGSGTAGATGGGGFPWTVGRALAPGYEFPFAGNLAGVALYSTQLTAARILTHAQAAGVA